MSLNYIFDSKDIHRFKYCPYCGNEIMQIYPGDYTGSVQCSKCDDDIQFDILEEMIDRFPEWWEGKKVENNK